MLFRGFFFHIPQMEKRDEREMDNAVAIAAVTHMQQLRAALEAERAEKHS